MFDAPTNVLFLCTGNSARSIISEALLHDLGGDRFRAFSAGSQPSGTPHPDGLTELRSRGHTTDRYRSKSWDIFARADAPIMDIIVTVCGNAANEICPIWPHRTGHSPITVHWPLDDPAHIEDDAARVATFTHVYDICRARITALIHMPHHALTHKAALQEIANLP